MDRAWPRHGRGGRRAAEKSGLSCPGSQDSLPGRGRPRREGTLWGNPICTRSQAQPFPGEGSWLPGLEDSSLAACPRQPFHLDFGNADAL